MASLGRAVYAQLNASSGVTSLTTAILPNYAPKNQTFPQIIYEVKATEYDNNYSGNSGVAKAEVIVKAIAKSDYNGQGTGYAQADALANAIIQAIDQESGDWGGITVQMAFLTDDTEDQYAEVDAESILYYARELTFEVWFNLS